MCAVSIKDVVIDFNGEDLSKYGLFPLFAWYLNDVIRLPEHFAQVSVNRKRNNRRKKQGRPPKYTDKQMCMGLVAISTLGIPRIYQIDDLLKTETQVAHLVGLQHFFDPSTAHRYINRFGKWHISQLDRINTAVLLAHFKSP